MIITDETLNIGSKVYDQIYKVFFVRNVQEYTNPSFDTWKLDTLNENIYSNYNIFLVIDTRFNEGIGHWIFESGIYLELFNILKKTYPTIKLKLKAKRKYKTLFCKLFNIRESDIVYGLPRYNICIFPSPISLLNDKTVKPEYAFQLTRLFKYINETPTKKYEDISYLLMPRQKKENFTSLNDRVVHFDDILQYFSDSPHINSHILDTDTVDDMTEQIRLVRASKNIILSGGSAYWVNGLFARNSNIFVLGDFPNQRIEYPKVSILYNYIKSFNNAFIPCYNQSVITKYLRDNIMLYIFGDSHADFSFRGLNILHQNFSETSVTMHRVGRDNIIPNFKIEMLSPQSIFIFTFGEIDCRCHIGKQVEAGRNIKEVCETLVLNYIQTIKNNIISYKNIIVCAVTPPVNKQKHESVHDRTTHEFPFIGSDQERLENMRIINSLVKTACERNNYTFLDCTKYYSGEDGLLVFEKSDRNVHILDNQYILQRLTSLLGSVV